MTRKNNPPWFRNRILRIHGYRCEGCGTGRDGVLQVHHIDYVNYLSAYHVVLLCKRCHNDVYLHDHKTREECVSFLRDKNGYAVRIENNDDGWKKKVKDLRKALSDLGIY